MKSNQINSLIKRSQRDNLKNTLSRCTLTLTVIAISLISYSAYMPMKAWLAQELISYNWQVNQLNNQSGDEIRSSSANLNSNKLVPPWPWADTTTVAKMEVPRLNKSIVLLKGTDPTTLAFSAGVMHQYSLLTEHTPFVVAGHRDTHFEFLQELKNKDVISLTDIYGKIQRYEIEEMNVINSEHSPLLINENDNSLILITCYPFNALRSGGSLRFVIKAKLS